MLVTITDIKPLKDKKVKLLTDQALVLYAEGEIVPSIGQWEMEIEPISKNGTVFNVVKKFSAAPALPKTNVYQTPAPGGTPPVKPASKETKNVDSEKMTKADWGAKDRSIETQAVLKSVLESPAYAQLVIGLTKLDAFNVGAEMFRFFLKEFYSAKG